jgi:hypothetical protein
LPSLGKRYRLSFHFASVAPSKTAGLQHIVVIERGIIVSIVGERAEAHTLVGQLAQLKEFLLFLALFISVNQSKTKDGSLKANGFCQSLQALFRLGL